MTWGYVLNLLLLAYVVVEGSHFELINSDGQFSKELTDVEANMYIAFNVLSGIAQPELLRDDLLIDWTINDQDFYVYYVETVPELATFSIVVNQTTYFEALLTMRDLESWEDDVHDVRFDLLPNEIRLFQYSWDTPGAQNPLAYIEIFSELDFSLYHHSQMFPTSNNHEEWHSTNSIMIGNFKTKNFFQTIPGTFYYTVVNPNSELLTAFRNTHSTELIEFNSGFSKEFSSPNFMLYMTTGLSLPFDFNHFVYLRIRSSNENIINANLGVETLPTPDINYRPSYTLQYLDDSSGMIESWFFPPNITEFVPQQSQPWNWNLVSGTEMSGILLVATAEYLPVSYRNPFTVDLTNSEIHFFTFIAEGAQTFVTVSQDDLVLIFSESMFPNRFNKLEATNENGVYTLTNLTPHTAVFLRIEGSTTEQVTLQLSTDLERTVNLSIYLLIGAAVVGGVLLILVVVLLGISLRQCQVKNRTLNEPLIV